MSTLPPPLSPSSATRVTLRLDFGPAGQVGPGKIRLLEAIGQHGSIAAAGRSMGMSYRRAWLLVDELNRTFQEAAVVTQSGGAHGGGATLTDWGRDLVRLYRAVEEAAVTGGRPALARIEARLAPT